MTIQEDIASIRSRLHQAESERIGWRMAGQQDKYIDACAMVEAIEVQLDERLAQSRGSSTAPPIAK